MKLLPIFPFYKFTNLEDPNKALDDLRSIVTNSIIANPARKETIRYVFKSLLLKSDENIEVRNATIRKAVIGTPI